MPRFKLYIRWIVFLLAIIVHLSFYMPIGTKSIWANFSPPAFIHNGYCGLDFLQLPCEAHALFEGESISGYAENERNPYAPFQWSNRNAYHF